MVKKLKVLKYTWFEAGIYLIWKLTEYANDHKVLKFLVNFFPKISTHSQDIRTQILALLGQKVTH